MILVLSKWWYLAVFLLIASAGLAACSLPVPTPAATPTLEVAPTQTPPPPATLTPTPTSTATTTLTPTPTLTPTALLLALPGTDLPDELAPIWSGNASQVSALAEFEQDAVVDLAWDPAGDALAVAGIAGITLYDVNNRTSMKFLATESIPVDIAFEPNQEWLAASFHSEEEGGGFKGGFQLWRMPSFSELGPLVRVDQAVGDLEFSLTGGQLAVVFTSQLDEENQVKIWNTVTWEISRTMMTGLVQRIAYSPDGVLLATSPDRYAVKIWQTWDGRERNTIYTSFTGAVNCLAFSPDGALLASGHYDGFIRIWDAAKGELVSSMGTGSVVESLAFSPDGTLLASGGGYQDNLLRLWDIESSLLIHALAGHSHSIDSLAFSPNGQILASGSYDGTVRLWGIRP